MRRVFLPLLVLAALACSLLTPAGPGPSVAPTAALTATPTAAAGPAYTGMFDCYGTEGGLGAYAGRLDFQPGGVVTFKDYDNLVQTGAWTYDAATGTFAFSGGTSLASAVYRPASDTLTVTLLPGASVVHAEGGSMQCQRAKPGITGPP